MIRINLLGQTRPKASRRPTMAVDTGGAMPVAFIGAGVLVGVLVLGFFYYTWEKQLTEENNKIKALQIQKTELEQTKQQVEFRLLDLQRLDLVVFFGELKTTRSRRCRSR